jgi:ribosomal protein S12 methylthiotransferase
MLGTLTRDGHEIVLDPREADVLVVNTCAFIGPAKEESIDAILEAAELKAAGRGRRLVVTGCLAQRYADDLRESLPEVDVFVGTGELARIADAVTGPSTGAPQVYRGAGHVLPPHVRAPRVRTGAWWTTYLKVSEGCDHQCSFCIIPSIRGRHESRALVDLLAEAEALAGDGVGELNLIAQDLTAYGRDRRDGATLAVLVRALAQRVPSLRWIRLLYAYPTSVTDELLEVMADEPAVCRYLDMPLQHASDRLLTAMRRPGAEPATRAGPARTTPHSSGSTSRRASGTSRSGSSSRPAPTSGATASSCSTSTSTGVLRVSATGRRRSSWTRPPARSRASSRATSFPTRAGSGTRYASGSTSTAITWTSSSTAI